MEREDKVTLIGLAISVFPMVLVAIGATLDSLIGHC